MDDLYQEVLLDVAAEPRHYGVLSDFDEEQIAHNASCGDELHLWLKWQGDVLSNIGWTGSGCIISQGAMSLLSDFVIGKSRSEIMKLQLPDMLDLLHIDTISPGRLKCLLLGLETLKKIL